MRKETIYRLKIQSTLLATTAILSLTCCNKESDFLFDAKTGELDCQSLSVDYIRTRGADVDVSDFTVNFIDTKSDETVKSYRYADMPEFVALPIGDYKAEAEYGDGSVNAAWENPHYLGSTGFSIEPGKVTTDLDPIKCSLHNMKIDVDVADETGMDIVGEDVCVKVSAGRSNLDYTQEHLHQTGYFKYIEGSRTIVAEFSGTVDGMNISNVRKVYDNAAAGNAYKIVFHVNRPDNTDPGSIGTVGGEISIDATITVIDVTEEVDPGNEDNYLEDDMRPGEDPGKDPDPGTDPNPGTDPKEGGPAIHPETEGLEVDTPFTIFEGATCKFSVSSDSGITAFTINIESDTLTSDTLEGVGLAADLDLINPGGFADSLSGLGFPVGSEVLNQKECHFDISDFLPLLQVLGPGNHKFNLDITDGEGNTKGTIWLVTE